MLDYIELGTAPIEEDCVQYKTDNYTIRAKHECRVFMNQLHRQFGSGTETNYFKIKHCPYDEDGGYYEVVVYYDPDNELSTQYAFDIECNLPLYWDDESKTIINNTISRDKLI